MPLPEVVNDETTACGISMRWTLDPKLAEMVIALARFTRERLTPAGIRGPAIIIISGYRTPETQAGLNPTVAKSCHVKCPALAVDLRLGIIEGIDRLAPELWAILGTYWEQMGGRWGGRFGVPIGRINEDEMNHFDLGPCI